MKAKTQKNLNTNRNEYNSYYGDFRGVDFSNDHTQVHNNRFAYLCNMYKDYRSKQGVAVETIPGYRMGFSVGSDGEDEIYAIHRLGEFVFVHCGSYLYHWVDYPTSCGVEHSAWVKLGDPVGTQIINGINTFQINLLDIANANGGELKAGATIVSAKYATGETMLIPTAKDNNVFEVSCSCKKGDMVHVTYVESMPVKIKGVGLSRRGSVSMTQGTEMLIMQEGEPGVDPVIYYIKIEERTKEIYAAKFDPNDEFQATIPKTHVGAIPDGVNADIGEEYQQINLLSPFFENTFFGTESNEQKLRLAFHAKSIVSVLVSGQVGGIYNSYLEAGSNPNQYEYDDVTNTVTIHGSSNLRTVITIRARREEELNFAFGGVTNYTIPCIHDDRIFLSGNKYHPNKIIFSKQFKTSSILPLYFGEDDYVSAGANGSVSGIIPVGNALAVFKKNTEEDASVCLFEKLVTQLDVVSVTYQKKQGINGVECYGACVNFRDDPVFLTKNGLDALGSISISYERALEHRSSLVDVMLCGMDLKKAFMTEYDGYLAVFVNGSVFLADSRQRYTDNNGTIQYEWYYLEDIGWYKGQYEAFRYATDSDFTGVTTGEYNLELAPEEQRGTIANATEDIKVHSVATQDGYGTVGVVFYVLMTDAEGKTHAYICESTSAYIGGTFVPASGAKSIGDTLVFSAGNKIFQFNFDKRQNGEFESKWYTFNGRTIVSGCATKMDNCGIPHLTKSTVKKSMVAKIKTLPRSTIKVKVRTNRNPYEQIERISNAAFSFDAMEFDDFTFSLDDSGLFCIKEKEKKWVEKQIYLYSDEHMRPFAIFYLASRYTIAGRFKD